MRLHPEGPLVALLELLPTPAGPFDDQVPRFLDPAAGGQCLEQRTVEAAGGTQKL
jgi:hypothetical protein